MVQGMWKHHTYSYKAQKKLKERAYKCINADGSRWVPHLHQTLQIQFFALNMLPRHDSSGEMQGRATNYSKKLKSFEFFKFMYPLLDVIKGVSKASLLFQRDDVTVSDLQHKIDTLCGALYAMSLRPGDQVR